MRCVKTSWSPLKASVHMLYHSLLMTVGHTGIPLDAIQETVLMLLLPQGIRRAGENRYHLRIELQERSGKCNGSTRTDQQLLHSYGKIYTLVSLSHMVVYWHTLYPLPPCYMQRSKMRLLSRTSKPAT